MNTSEHHSKIRPLVNQPRNAPYPARSTYASCVVGTTEHCCVLLYGDSRQRRRTQFNGACPASGNERNHLHATVAQKVNKTTKYTVCCEQEWGDTRVEFTTTVYLWAAILPAAPTSQESRAGRRASVILSDKDEEGARFGEIGGSASFL